MNAKTLPFRADDDWLDAALRADGREHRESYLDDAGFTARLMSALPPPVTLPAWRKPAITFLWGSAGVAIATALPTAVVSFAHEVVRMIVGQPISMAGIAAGVVALGAATWGATALVALRSD